MNFISLYEMCFLLPLLLYYLFILLLLYSSVVY